MLEWFTAADGSRYASKFALAQLDSTAREQQVTGLSAAFEVTSLALDSRTKWASGGDYYEGAVEARDIQTGKIIGYGYTEGVGWDKAQVKKTVATALRLTDVADDVVGLLSSRPPHTRPPRE